MRKERILIKLSGEALMGEKSFGLDNNVINQIALQIKKVLKLKIEICMVVGGGNIFRGISASASGIDRSTADYMGMLATLINALSLQNALEKVSVPTRVQSAIAPFTDDMLSENHFKDRKELGKAMYDTMKKLENRVA